MFSFFKKDSQKKLQQSYESMLKKAVDAQRAGDIQRYSELIAESEKISLELESLSLKNKP